MKSIKYKGLNLELYDTIEEMPYRKYQAFNTMALIDLGVGSSLDSVDNHYANIKKLSGDKLKLEITNYRQNLHFIIQNISPELRCFTCLVAKINSKDVSMLPPKDVESRINHIPFNIISGALDLFKKKVNTELEIYFPNNVNKTLKEQAFIDFKRLKIFQLDEILGFDRSKEMAEIEKEVYERYKPIDISTLEVESTKAYNNMCFMMEKYVSNPKGMSVLEFYQALETINNKDAKSN